MTTCKMLTSREKTLNEAREIRDRFIAVRVLGSPLRFFPCIIHGPNEGFLVVKHGFALANGFEEIR